MTWGTGVKVRLVGSPGAVGFTTGKSLERGGRTYIEVDFPGSPPVMRPVEAFEPCPEATDPLSDLRRARASGPKDLVGVINLERLRGELTNVVYSMGAGRTDFYPHQFKPVLKFVKSDLGRILIADEVGLGKTIEAAYIWKELEVRSSARRLLIVCPSMLRPKWRRDLSRLFGIEADEADAARLLAELRRAEKNRNHSFQLVVSLESVRPPGDFEQAKSPRAELARLLDGADTADEEPLIDLTIIDEAHYLRNPTTASNLFGSLVRDASAALVLLTATPIQISDDNLFQLLTLVDPEDYPSSWEFQHRLRENRPIVQALNILRGALVDTGDAVRALDTAIRGSLFSKDAGLREMRRSLAAGLPSKSEQIAMCELLEGRSLMGAHMTRSRKRDVLERRVERHAQSAKVTFNETELAAYTSVTAAIRQRMSGADTATSFSLIMRQRQMASSLPAAVANWRDTGLLEEMLWEDFGEDPEFDLIDPPEIAPPPQANELEAHDSKYLVLREALQKELGESPGSKVVVFAFFKATLSYLEKRLVQDGISCVRLTGGMGDEQQEILDRFAQVGGPAVLLSSEVASEGVDLQFARMLVNYDLPWNPMRVEQRIGRLDRLGQQAEAISIINLFVENTVEERILKRLYDRIGIFKDGVGDLDEILGEISRDLLDTVMSPSLSDTERERAAEQAVLAAEQRVAQVRTLEDEAHHLLGLGDFVLGRISEQHDDGDWIRPADLKQFVEDALARRFSRSRLELDPASPEFARLKLCEDARAALYEYLADCEPSALARGLLREPLIFFDPAEINRRRGAELIDAGHPLIRWLRHEMETEGVTPHASVAIRISGSALGVGPGLYGAAVVLRSLRGVTNEVVLETCVVSLAGGEPLVGEPAESVRRAMERGERAILAPDQLRDAAVAAENARDHLFGLAVDRAATFKEDNDRRCDQREASARAFFDRKVESLTGRIERASRAPGRSIAPALQGQLRRRQEELEAKLLKIGRARLIDDGFRLVAAAAVEVV